MHTFEGPHTCISSFIPSYMNLSLQKGRITEYLRDFVIAVTATFSLPNLSRANWLLPDNRSSFLPYCHFVLGHLLVTLRYGRMYWKECWALQSHPVSVCPLEAAESEDSILSRSSHGRFNHVHLTFWSTELKGTAHNSRFSIVSNGLQLCSKRSACQEVPHSSSIPATVDKQCGFDLAP